MQTTLQRFYDVLSSMYSAVLLVTEEGRVEFANQAFCDYFGLEEAPMDLAGLDSRAMIEKIKNVYLHPEEAVRASGKSWSEDNRSGARNSPCRTGGPA